MKWIESYLETDAKVMNGEGLQGVAKRLMIGPQDGSPLMALRIFTLEPGGHTPRHAHPWEHLNFVIRGRGVILTEQGERPIGPGTVILVEPGELHRFRNTGADLLEFICLVPNAQEAKNRTG